jgi:DHA1 family bicyclomycin/chloramphenicol resistance-like MFS transporter
VKAVPRGLAALLAAMTAIGPFSIDAYMPAFPAIGAGLGASPVEVQQTLTAYLLPFAFMTLWHGALADALGRRRVLLVAYAVYALASLLCALAWRIEVLWLGRALQGLSAGAGMVVSRAVVRDLLDGPAAQKLMAHIGMLFAVAPAIAPVIGGWIHAFFDWHGIFVFLVGYGMVLFFAIHRWLPETLPPEARQSLHPVLLARAYREVFSSPVFLALAAAVALHFNGFFIYVLSSPVFLMTHLGVSTRGFLWFFGPATVGLMAGSYLSSRLAGRLSHGRTTLLGYAIMAVAAATNLAFNLTTAPHLPWAVVPLAIYVVATALAMTSQGLLISDLFPEKRGLVSSCQSVLQTGVNALTASILAPLVWGSMLDLSLAMVAFLALSAVVAAPRR